MRCLLRTFREFGLKNFNYGKFCLILLLKNVNYFLFSFTIKNSEVKFSCENFGEKDLFCSESLLM